MEQDYKLKMIQEYNNNGKLELNWFMLVEFDNGDVLKVVYNDIDNSDIDTPIREYRISKRNKKINKILNGK